MKKGNLYTYGSASWQLPARNGYNSVVSFTYYDFKTVQECNLCGVKFRTVWGAAHIVLGQNNLENDPTSIASFQSFCCFFLII